MGWVAMKNWYLRIHNWLHTSNEMRRSCHRLPIAAYTVGIPSEKRLQSECEGEHSLGRRKILICTPTTNPRFIASGG